jgi:APA family basic amino acid/polyamine antiporter
MAQNNSADSPRDGLRRQLGLFSAVMIICGDMIGIGIFVTTGDIAQSIASSGGILLIWLIGGLLALAGALCCAELAAGMPLAGGDYNYLRAAYGPLVGFLSGWSSFLVTFCGSIALLAVVFAVFVSFFFPVVAMDHVLFTFDVFGYSMGISAGQILALLVVYVLTAIHYVGVRTGAAVQNTLTVFKMGAMVAIVLLGVFIGKGSLEHFSPFFEWDKMKPGLFGLAFIPVIFTYAGWNAAIYMAGEVREPEKNLPRALIRAVLLVTLLYLAINAVYFYAVPADKMKGAIRVSELATTALFGRQTSAWITAIITVSILGAMNVTSMIGPRVYYAMARDGLFFASLARVHPSFHTPSNAIVFQAAWVSILILTGSFGTLLSYVSVTIGLFSVLTVGSLLVLRAKRPDLPRPYKIPGYPWVPWLFILANLAITGSILWEKPIDALRGFVIVALGVPAYFFWKSRTKKFKG